MEKRVFFHVAKRTQRIIRRDMENCFESSLGRNDILGYFPKEEF
jgi:hypothetical protein